MDLDKPVLFQEVKDFDVIYVCGGNTFYLLKKIREIGFDKVIIEFTKTDKLYLGVSAGSILVNPNISAANVGLDPDKNDVDLTGLNLTDVVVSPIIAKKKTIIDEFKKKSQYKVVPLTDSQALLVIGRETKIIDGVCI